MRRFTVPVNATTAAYLLGAAEAVGARAWLPWLRSELNLPPGHPAQPYLDSDRYKEMGREDAQRLKGSVRSRKRAVVREIEREYKASRRRAAWPVLPSATLARLWAPYPVARMVLRTRVGAQRADAQKG